MKASLILIALAVSMALASAADKPTVYHRVTKDGGPIDEQVATALAVRYTVVPVEDSSAYINAKVTGGSLPHSAKSASGEALSGYVLVAYVISAQGHAIDPIVLKSTDPRLDPFALQATKTWRFDPAKLNGLPIATTAAQEFNFEASGPATGFTMDNIVLYQPNPVLVQRLPGGADSLAAYIKQLQAVLTDFFVGAKFPETLHTVVAIRPGNLSRVWLVSSTRSGKAEELAPLRQKLEAITPVEVTGGPVAFVLSGSIAGGDGKNPKPDKHFQPPVPQEWQEAGKNLKTPVLVPDDYLNVVWPARE